MGHVLTRRDVLRAGLGAGASLAVLMPAATRRARAAANFQVTLYHDPNCACCLEWLKHAEKSFSVEVVATRQIMDVKKKLDVPYDLMACHTAVVDKYVIEGHVPAADIGRLLRERPVEVRGLAVPGMPIGAPGMETPDGRVDPYTVLAFRADGQLRVWSRYGGA